MSSLGEPIEVSSSASRQRGIRDWLRFENPVVPEGVKPFLFGWHQNKHSVWEVRSFSHPDYPNIPANFDLYRRDNQVSGGSYNADFDAWLVPR